MKKWGMIFVCLLGMCGNVFADDTQVLLKKVAGKASSLALIQCQVSEETGLQKLVGTGVCVSQNGIFMTYALPAQIRPETITSIELVLPGPNKDTIKAKLLGIDPVTGLGFVQAQSSRNWQRIAFLSKAGVKLGDKVASIGLAVDDPALSPTLGQAYIASMRRNPGRMCTVTGGSLSGFGSVVFNDKGDAIGLVGNQPFLRYVTMMRYRSVNMPLKREDLAIAFVPAEDFVYVLRNIPSDGKVRRLPWVGVGRFAPVPTSLAEAKGLTRPAVMVDQIIPNGVAAAKGVKNRDMIVAVNGQPLPRLGSPELEAECFTQMLMRGRIGQNVKLTLLSDGKQRDVTLKMSAMPKLPSEARRYFNQGLGILLREKVPVDRYLTKGPTANIPGMLVMSVGQLTPAGKAGLQRGDVIMTINRKEVTKADKCEELIKKATEAGLDLKLVVQRGNATESLTIKNPAK